MLEIIFIFIFFGLVYFCFQYWKNLSFCAIKVNCFIYSCGVGFYFFICVRFYFFICFVKNIYLRKKILFCV
nr:MAG TPA: hypothetical protein [Caudoviricetes sp.]